MYEKQNFLPGQKLKADQLNHMEEGIAAALEQGGGGSASTYVITGTWVDDVVTLDNFNWGDLKNAINNHQRVSCRLTHESEQSWSDYHLVDYYTSDWDEYHEGKETGSAYFEHGNEDAETMRLWIYSDGSAERYYRDAFMTYDGVRDFVKWNGFHMCLLWESEDADAPLEDGSFFVPDMFMYEAIEIVHRTDAAEEASVRIFRGGDHECYLNTFRVGDGLIQMFSRYVSVDFENSRVQFDAANQATIRSNGSVLTTMNVTGCIPFRVYGVKNIQALES